MMYRGIWLNKKNGRSAREMCEESDRMGRGEWCLRADFARAAAEVVHVGGERRREARVRHVDVAVASATAGHRAGAVPAAVELALADRGHGGHGARAGHPP